MRKERQNIKRTEKPKQRRYSEGELMGAHVLSGRVFGIFPSYPLSLHGYCLEEPRVRRGCVHCTTSILYASPTHRHPPQRVNPVHLILAFFVLHKPPSSQPSSSFNSCFVCTLVRFRTPSYIRAVPVGSTVDGEKKEEIRREHGRKGVRQEGDRERDKESTKSRG